MKGIGGFKRRFATGGDVSTTYGYGPETNFFPNRTFRSMSSTLVPPPVTIDPLTYGQSDATSYDTDNSGAQESPDANAQSGVGRGNSAYTDVSAFGPVGSMVGGVMGFSGLGTLGNAIGVGVNQTEANSYLEAAHGPTLGLTDYLSALANKMSFGLIGTNVPDAVAGVVGHDPDLAAAVAQAMMDEASRGMSASDLEAAGQRAGDRDRADAAWGNDEGMQGNEFGGPSDGNQGNSGPSDNGDHGDGPGESSDGGGGGGAGGADGGDGGDSGDGGGDGGDGYARGGVAKRGLGQKLISPAAQAAEIHGPGGGQADLIDARLADNENVWDADTVAALGDGSSDEGHRVLAKTKELIRAHKRSASSKNIPPKSKGILAYMIQAKRSMKNG